MSQCLPLCRYRALAGQAVRALRLDAHLTLLHHLARLPRGHWTPEADSPQDVEDCITALSRALSQAQEDLVRCLSPSWRGYVFGGLSAAAPTFCMWLLPDLRVRYRA